MFDRILGATALAIVLSSPAFAQAQPDSPAREAPLMQAIPDAGNDAPAQVSAFVAGQGEGELTASDLLGRPLYDTAGTAVGTITDLLVDENGRLSLVVVDVSEKVGTDKRVAFAFDTLRYEEVDSDIRLLAAVDRGALEAAPPFTSLADAAALNDFQGIAEGDGDAEPAVAPQ